MNNIAENYKIKNKKTLNEKVYETLKKMIINGVLKPNQKLNENQIAEILGVSATPVREAFRILSAEGFVQVFPYKGVYVKEYTTDELKEVYQCRRVLEILALELAFPNITDEDVDEMIKLLDENRAKNDIESNVEMSNALHAFIIEKSGNKRIKILIDSLNDVLLRDRNISANDLDRKKQIYTEHIEILKNIKDGKLEAAKESLAKHIDNGYHYIEKKTKKQQ